MYKCFFKRLLDFTLSLIGLIILSPIFILLWLILLFVNRSAGAFFTQSRPGKNGRIFKVIKFKTMNDKKDEHGQLLPAEKRITRIGQIIRSNSIDEIPQLINVLMGDMSLVGPRPLRIEYLSVYSEFQTRRHEEKPGITGWAQINGRNSLCWEERFNFDVWYVDNICFMLDMKILFKTINNVLARKGINSKNEKLMEPFKGVKLNG